MACAGEGRTASRRGWLWLDPPRRGVQANRRPRRPTMAGLAGLRLVRHTPSPLGVRGASPAPCQSQLEPLGLARRGRQGAEPEGQGARKRATRLEPTKDARRLIPSKASNRNLEPFLGLDQPSVGVELARRVRTNPSRACPAGRCWESDGCAARAPLG